MRTIGVIGSQLLKTDLFNPHEKQTCHFRIYTEDGETGYVNDGRFPLLKVVDTVEEIMQDPSIDAVYVEKQNMGLIGRAISAGKSVRVI